MHLEAEKIVLHLAATNRTSSCPHCHQYASRVHSHYQRTVADLPLGEKTTLLKLRVRRFRCDNAECAAHIFAEQWPLAFAPYARRTHRLDAALIEIAYTLVGQAGAALAASLAIGVSGSTLLRLLHAQPLPTYAAPRAVGVDDWAWRKGERYGTLFTDLQRHRPIALLPDRSASSVSEWFKAHPTVSIVARDRAGVYIEGVTTGASAAQQVVDRFHLMKNLRDNLEHFFLNQRPALKQAQARLDQAEVQNAPAPSSASANPQEQDQASGETPPSKLRTLPLLKAPGAEVGSRLAEHEQKRIAPQVETYHKVHELYAKKVDKANIARQLGLSRPTVYHYLTMSQPPQPKRPGGRVPVMAAHSEYVIQRWNEGCRNASQIRRELAEQGHELARATVERFVRQLRRDSGQARKFKAVAPQTIYQLSVKQRHPLSPLQAARLMVSRVENRKDWQKRYLAELYELEPQIAKLDELVRGFCEMVRQRKGEKLEEWLGRAEGSEIKELASLANGIRKDYKAVQAGLSLEWSNAQSEGQINRLKLLKRQTYGRAGFELLSRRVLHRSKNEQKRLRDPRSEKKTARTEPTAQIAA